MAEYIINGCRRLNGCIEIQGAKNSALPILAASILCRDEVIIHNCPQLTDVDTAIKILRYLGCIVYRDGNTVVIDSNGIYRCDIPSELMREMRSSIIFLGAMLGRMKQAQLSPPGGCELGPRPIDLHLSAFAQMGMSYNDTHGKLDCDAGKGLNSADITLSFPSVGATENIILGAVCAKGITTITNAAREPEICDLADFLNSCGARIKGAGESTIYIEGVKALGSAQHCIIPDRIVAATYMACTAVCGGKLFLKGAITSHLGAINSVLEQSWKESSSSMMRIPLSSALYLSIILRISFLVVSLSCSIAAAIFSTSTAFPMVKRMASTAASIFCNSIIPPDVS